MKNNGLERVKETLDNRIITKLKYVSSINGRIGFRGYTQNDLVDEGDGAITISPSNIKGMNTDFSKCTYVSWYKYNESPEIKVCKGDIILVKTGSSYGKSALIQNLPQPATINPQLVVLKDIKINKKILFYFLQTDFVKRQMDLAVIGGAIPTMTQVKIGNTILILPPISEQKVIAEFLDKKCGEVDALIADIQQEIETLEQYKRSVITESVTKGLDPSVPMKDSGIQWIGNMPTNWECIRGKYILKYLQKPVKKDDGVITCFRDGEVTLRSNRREDGFTMADKEIGYQGVDIGDLVVHGMDGFAGAIGISDSRGKASPVLNVLGTKQNKRYIMYYLRSMAYSDVFMALSTGIRVRSCDLRWNKLAELWYPIPPLTEQEEIVAYIDETIQKINEIIADKKSQIETLESYKKSLIYEYVTGKKEIIVQ